MTRLLLICTLVLLASISSATEPYEVNGPSGGLTSHYVITDQGAPMARVYCVAENGGEAMLYERPASQSWWNETHSVPAADPAGNGLLPYVWPVGVGFWVFHELDEVLFDHPELSNGYDAFQIDNMVRLLDAFPSPSVDDESYLLVQMEDGMHRLYRYELNQGPELVDPFIEGYVMAYGGAQDTLYTTGLWSPDAGQTWLAYEGNFVADYLFKDPSDPDHALYRVTLGEQPWHMDRVQRSANRGFSWNNVLEMEDIASVSIDQDGELLVLDEEGAARISQVGGEGWEVLELNGAAVGAAALDWDDEAWVAHLGQPFRYTDSFAERTPEAEGLNMVTVHTLGARHWDDEADTLFAAAREGLFRSLDWGLSWELVQEAVIGPAFPGMVDVAVCRSNPMVVYAITDHRVFRSEDGGATFDDTPVQPTGTLTAIEVHPDDPDMIFVRSTTSLQRSLNAGAVWTAMASWNPPSYPNTRRLEVRVPWNDDPRIYALGAENEIVSSDDGGFTFNVDSIELPDGRPLVDYYELHDLEAPIACADSMIFIWPSDEDEWEAPTGNLGGEIQWISPSSVEATQYWEGAVKIDDEIWGVWLGIMYRGSDEQDELDSWDFPDGEVNAFFASYTGAAAAVMVTGGVAASPDTYVAVEDEPNGADTPLPRSLTLTDAWPNPFNPAVTLRLAVPQRSTVKVEVYDITGRRVARLHRGALIPGEHAFTWHAAGQASGIYLLVASDGSGAVATRKVTLLK